MKSNNCSSSNYEDVPVWHKYALSVKEAAQYFNIGQKKILRLAGENKDADWLLMNGEYIRIKRQLFERMLDEVSSI